MYECVDCDHLLHRANAEAKPELYRMLEQYRDAEYGRFKVLIFRLLGYIGNSDDAVKLQESLANYSGSLTAHRVRGDLGAVRETILAIGMLARRGVPEANAILNEMLSPKYWEQFEWQWSKSKNALPTQLESLCWVIHACVIARREDVSDQIQLSLDGISDRATKEAVAMRLHLPRLLEAVRMAEHQERQIPSADERSQLRTFYEQREKILEGYRVLPEEFIRYRKSLLLDEPDE